MGQSQPKEKSKGKLGATFSITIEGDEKENKFKLFTKRVYQRDMNTSQQKVEQELLSQIWGDAVSEEDIRNLYIFDKKSLGAGHFGYVRRAKFICDSSRLYSVKSILINNLKGDSYLLKREFDMLRMMDHPNIIKFFDFYKDKNYVHLVMENCSGGDLFSKLLAEKRFSEEYSRKVMFDVINAVSHLHSRGICHRDLRLENFLVLNRVHSDIVKLADFGLAKMFSSSELKTRVGAYYYVAPEIFKGAYTNKVDSWSIGVMLYIMITGEPPFNGRTPNEILEEIEDGDYSMKQEVWESVSAECKDLLSGLLKINPNDRLSINKALEHGWFKPFHDKLKNEAELYIKKDLLDRFKGFRKMTKFQKEVVKLMMMIFHDTEEVQKLNHFFFYLDINHGGMLTVEDLRTFFNNFGEAVSESDIEDIMKDLNLRFRTSITLTEFQALTVESFFIRDTKNIKAVYDRVRAQVPPYVILSDEQLEEIKEEERKKKEEHLKEEKKKMEWQQKMKVNFARTITKANIPDGSLAVPDNNTMHRSLKTQKTEVFNEMVEPIGSQIDMSSHRPRTHTKSSGIPDPIEIPKDEESEEIFKRNERPPELTGEILRNSLKKFGARITAEGFDEMLQDIRKNSSKSTVLTYEEFANAMKKINN